MAGPGLGALVLEGDGDDEESLTPSVMTLRSRSSILPNGKSAFDQALRYPVFSRYRRSVRHIETGYRAFVNAVCLTDRHCPVQIRDFGKDELRMRSAGVLGGNGTSLVFFDAEYGTIIKGCHDLLSPIMCMSMTAPSRRVKLAPLLACGMRDGRILLWDMQTAAPLYETLSTIVHAAPIRSIHICEGTRTLCAVGTHDDFMQSSPVVRCFNFEAGRCDHEIRDHGNASRVSAITSCCVQSVHSLLITGGTDGKVFVYDLFTFERLLTLGDPKVLLQGGRLDEANSGDPPAPSVCVYGLAAVPGRLAGRDRRNKPFDAIPSLVVAACRDSLLRVWRLDDGRLLHRLYGHDRGTQVFCVAGLRTRTPGCVSGGEDGSVRIWDLHTGCMLQCFRGHPFHVDSVVTLSATLSPRLMFVSGGMDGRTIVWDLDFASTAAPELDAPSSFVRGLGQGLTMVAVDEQEEQGQGLGLGQSLASSSKAFRLGSISGGSPSPSSPTPHSLPRPLSPSQAPATTPATAPADEARGVVSGSRSSRGRGDMAPPPLPKWQLHSKTYARALRLSLAESSLSTSKTGKMDRFSCPGLAVAFSVLTRRLSSVQRRTRPASTLIQPFSASPSPSQPPPPRAQEGDQEGAQEGAQDGAQEGAETGEWAEGEGPSIRGSGPESVAEIEPSLPSFHSGFNSWEPGPSLELLGFDDYLTAGGSFFSSSSLLVPALLPLKPPQLQTMRSQTSVGEGFFDSPSLGLGQGLGPGLEGGEDKGEDESEA